MKKNFLMSVLVLSTVLSSCSKDEILQDEDDITVKEDLNIPLTRSEYDGLEILPEMEEEYWLKASQFQKKLVEFTKSMGKSLSDDQWGQIWAAFLHYKNVEVSIYNKNGDYNTAYVYKIKIVDSFWENSCIADKRLFDLNGEYVATGSLNPEADPKYMWNESLSGKYAYYYEIPSVHNIPSSRAVSFGGDLNLSYAEDERYWDNTRKFTDLVFAAYEKLTGLRSPGSKTYNALQKVYHNYHNLDVYFFIAIDEDGKPTDEIFAYVYEGDKFKGRSNIIYVPNMIKSNGSIWAFPLEFSGVMETKIIPTWER